MPTMLTAEEARSKARKDSVIHAEIRDVEVEILTAIQLGNLSVVVNGTTMTYDDPITDPTAYAAAQVYYNVWQGLATDKAIEDQMNQVIKHFTNLGYSIVRLVNPSTQITYNWSIEW